MRRVALWVGWGWKVERMTQADETTAGITETDEVTALHVALVQNYDRAREFAQEEARSLTPRAQAAIDSAASHLYQAIRSMHRARHGQDPPVKPDEKPTA